MDDASVGPQAGWMPIWSKNSKPLFLSNLVVLTLLPAYLIPAQFL